MSFYGWHFFVITRDPWQSDCRFDRVTTGIGRNQVVVCPIRLQEYSVWLVLCPSRAVDRKRIVSACGNIEAFCTWRTSFAFANWRTNPNTGEIRGASVYFGEPWVSGAIGYFSSINGDPTSVTANKPQKLANPAGSKMVTFGWSKLAPKPLAS